MRISKIFAHLKKIFQSFVINIPSWCCYTSINERLERVGWRNAQHSLDTMLLKRLPQGGELMLLTSHADERIRIAPLFHPAQIAWALLLRHTLPGMQCFTCSRLPSAVVWVCVRVSGRLNRATAYKKSDNDQYLLNSSMHARAEHTRKLDARLERFFAPAVPALNAQRLLSPRAWLLGNLFVWWFCLLAPSSLLQWAPSCARACVSCARERVCFHPFTFHLLKRPTAWIGCPACACTARGRLGELQNGADWSGRSRPVGGPIIPRLPRHDRMMNQIRRWC